MMMLVSVTVHAVISMYSPGPLPGLHILDRSLPCKSKIKIVFAVLSMMKIVSFFKMRSVISPMRLCSEFSSGMICTDVSIIEEMSSISMALSISSFIISIFCRSGGCFFCRYGRSIPVVMIIMEMSVIVMEIFLFIVVGLYAFSFVGLYRYVV